MAYFVYIPRLGRRHGPPLPAALRWLGGLSLCLGFAQLTWLSVVLIAAVPLGRLSGSPSTPAAATPTTTAGPFKPPTVVVPRFEIPADLPIGVRADPDVGAVDDQAAGSAAFAAPRGAAPAAVVLPVSAGPTGRPWAAQVVLAMKAVGWLLAVVLMLAGALTLRGDVRGRALHRGFGVARLGLSAAVAAFWCAAVYFVWPMATGSASRDYRTLWDGFFLMLLGMAAAVVMSVVYPAVVLVVLRQRSVRDYYDAPVSGDESWRYEPGAPRGEPNP